MKTDYYCDSVLSGQVAVQVVVETERVLAFEHTNPSWQMHIVVIPKRHIQRLVDVDDLSLIGEMFNVMIKVIQDRKLGDLNYKIITNGGSYQSTQHLHFHLVSGAPLNPSNPAQSGELMV